MRPISVRISPADGQASVEHVGLVVLLALALVTMATVEARAAPAGAIVRAICSGLGGDCPGEPTSPAQVGQPAPAASAPPSELESVELQMSISLEGFLARRGSGERDPRLDWSSDECSAPLVGSTGASFDFTEACLRHDFGYRNYDRLGAFWRRKASVDERFLADMRDHCETRPQAQLARCRAWARAFHLAVRHFGALSGHGRGER